MQQAEIIVLETDIANIIIIIMIIVVHTIIIIDIVKLV